MIRLLTTLFIFSFFISCQSDKSPSLRIAGASNMKFALEQLVNHFEARTGIETEFIAASSGKLTAQIKEGAPFDVFLSADLKFPLELYKLGLTSEAPKVYAKQSRYKLVNTTQICFLPNLV